jgi:hypothetical protein
MTLRERIEREAGVRVWLDKKGLRGGDEWEQKIDDSIKGCSVFVPVISAHVGTGRFRFVRMEWHAAIERMRGVRSDAHYIVPIVLDDTREDNPALDSRIRQLQWFHLGDSGEMSQFVGLIREEVSRAREPAR